MNEICYICFKSGDAMMKASGNVDEQRWKHCDTDECLKNFFNYQQALARRVTALEERTGDGETIPSRLGE